jgi:hypothetical protein
VFFSGKQAVTMSDENEQKIQLVEESVSVEKERVPVGRVRVSTSGSFSPALSPRSSAATSRAAFPAVQATRQAAITV